MVKTLPTSCSTVVHQFINIRQGATAQLYICLFVGSNQSSKDLKKTRVMLEIIKLTTFRKYVRGHHRG